MRKYFYTRFALSALLSLSIGSSVFGSTNYHQDNGLAARVDELFAQWDEPQESSDARKFRNQGIEHYEGGRFEEAIEAFRKASRLKPDYAQAYNDLGMAYVGLNRRAEAIEQFRQAIHLNPQLSPAHYNLGTTYYKLGQLQEAIEQFRRAISLKPDYAWAHNNLGVAYFESGFKDGPLKTKVLTIGDVKRVRCWILSAIYRSQKFICNR
jgi:tetratricopeptide (TPR) repeat protein